LVYSGDLGAIWSQRDRKVGALDTAMAFDVHFFNFNQGVIAAGSSADVTQANAFILTSNDVGVTWTTAYQSSRQYELTWKISFSTRDVGYVTIQSYDPDLAVSKRYVAKTTDGGAIWAELLLVDDRAVRQFGIVFIDANRGWIGTMPNGFATVDGGATWTKTNFGNAVNKISVIKAADAYHAFSIGVSVARTTVPIDAGGEEVSRIINSV